MSAPAMKERIAQESPRLDAGFAVVFYLLTALAGVAVFFIHEWLGFAIVTACYLAVTALVYAYPFVVRDRVRVAQFLRPIAVPSPGVHKEARRTI
jgi:Flp pilus assembly protein TadB